MVNEAIELEVRIVTTLRKRRCYSDWQGIQGVFKALIGYFLIQVQGTQVY